MKMSISIFLTNGFCRKVVLKHQDYRPRNEDRVFNVPASRSTAIVSDVHTERIKGVRSRTDLGNKKKNVKISEGRLVTETILSIVGIKEGYGF